MNNIINNRGINRRLTNPPTTNRRLSNPPFIPVGIKTKKENPNIVAYNINKTIANNIENAGGDGKEYLSRIYNSACSKEKLEEIYSKIKESIPDDLERYENIRIFLETGLLWGTTTFNMCALFDKVYSIEASYYFYLATLIGLNSNTYYRKGIDYANMNLKYGLSESKIIDVIVNNIKNDKVIFFLDAHWSQGDTHKGKLPLNDELTAINSLYNNDCIIIIDDYDLFDSSIDENIWKECTINNMLAIFDKNKIATHFEYCREEARNSQSKKTQYIICLKRVPICHITIRVCKKGDILFLEESKNGKYIRKTLIDLSSTHKSENNILKDYINKLNIDILPEEVDNKIVIVIDNDTVDFKNKVLFFKENSAISILNCKNKRYYGALKDIPTDYKEQYVYWTNNDKHACTTKLPNIPIIYKNPNGNPYFYNEETDEYAYKVNDASYQNLGNYAFNKIIWSEEYLKDMLEKYTVDNISTITNSIITGKLSAYDNILKESYPGTSDILCRIFNKYSINNFKIAIIGSQVPWIEAICVNHGGAEVTSVEYNPPECNNNIIKCIDLDTFIHQKDEYYDMIIQFSSIEHSGLGRYGDILNPFGDVETMEIIYDKLKPTGLCLMGQPVGQDAIYWNAHRVYGKFLLPILFQKFILLEWYDNKLQPGIGLDCPLHTYRQPIAVLSKKKIYLTNTDTPWR